MTVPSSHPILSELQDSPSPISQVKALKDLKNEVIGHEYVKELWIGRGILAPLAHILRSHKSNGKSKEGSLHASQFAREDLDSWSPEDEARLQAIIVVGSLAYGGPAFIQPIYAAFIIPPLLSLLPPAETRPHIVLQTLRTLNTIADSDRLSNPGQHSHEKALRTLLYTQPHLSSLIALLLQEPSTFIVQRQIALTASLIVKTCCEEREAAMLARAGLLGTLAIALSPWIAYTGRKLRNDYSPKCGHQQSAGSNLIKEVLLDAVIAIIKDSRSRAKNFLDSAELVSAFDIFAESCSYVEAEKTSAFDTGCRGQIVSFKALESALPRLSPSCTRSSSPPSSSYPPLGYGGAQSRQTQASRSFSTAIEIGQSQSLEYVGEKQHESPFVLWLIYVFRTSADDTALAVAELLVVLHRLRLVRRASDSYLALILVPSLVRMLDDSPLPLENGPREDETFVAAPLHRIKREAAPAILSILMNGNADIQKAAADAGIIRKLSRLLKESYERIPQDASACLWTSDTTAGQTISHDSEACRLGPAGISPTTYHTLRLRESVLTAIAAIASCKDEYRKPVIEAGVIPLIVRTLKAESAIPPTTADNDITETSSQNLSQISWIDREAMLAACGAARALSRSVSTLRTSLMDAGLAPPLVLLLNSHDVEMQVASTAVITNLLLKFSPIREGLINDGIVKVLCEHAHSINSKLRLNSLWALKHLINSASTSVKTTCLDRLGPSWLKDIIVEDAKAGLHEVTADDSHIAALTASSAPNAANAAGEQVELLNVNEVSTDDMFQTTDDGDQDLTMSDSNIVLHEEIEREAKRKLWADRPDRQTSWVGEAGNAGTSSLSPRNLPDEVAIQKEGIDFLRNFISGDDASEMIDHLLMELGQDNLFDLLATRLRPKILNAFDREGRSSDHGVRHIQPAQELIVSACCTLVHIAAGQSRHRQLLISQTELLKLVLPFFSHPSQEVRCCCAWIAINLTWADDHLDRPNAKLRAHELQRLGFLEKITAMEKDDSLDCRERAKTARVQIKDLFNM